MSIVQHYIWVCVYKINIIPVCLCFSVFCSSSSFSLLLTPQFASSLSNESALPPNLLLPTNLVDPDRLSMKLVYLIDKCNVWKWILNQIYSVLLFVLQKPNIVIFLITLISLWVGYMKVFLTDCCFIPSCRASTTSCRLLSASSEEVWCCSSCSLDPCADLGGVSGETGQRAVGCGSTSPWCVCSSSEVTKLLLTAFPFNSTHFTAPTEMCKLIFVVIPQAWYSTQCWNMAEKLQKDCKLQFINVNYIWVFCNIYHMMKHFKLGNILFIMCCYIELRLCYYI